jgi:hypothetical protein
LRKELWFVVWAVVTLLIVLAGGFTRLGGALLLAPFVLILADNAVAIAMNDLLDYEGRRSPRELLRIFGRNLVLAFATTALAGLFFWAWSTSLQGGGLDIMPTQWDGEAVRAYGAHALQGAFAPTLAAGFVILAISWLVNLYGHRRLDKGRDLSSTGVTLFVMLAALAIQLGLAWLLTPWIIA